MIKYRQDLDDYRRLSRAAGVKEIPTEIWTHGRVIHHHHDFVLAVIQRQGSQMRDYGHDKC